MKKTNISKFIAVGLCICALTGCGASPNEKPDTSNPIVNSNTNEENTNGSSENKGNDILESANLRGSVLEFTDNGCLVNQAKDIEGGAGIKIEAPGMENKDNAVSVTYTQIVICHCHSKCTVWCYKCNNGFYIRCKKTI